MLVHVTLSHTEDNCPAYDQPKMPDFVTAIEKIGPLAKELKAKVHFFVWGAPEHVAYALIEADSIATVSNIVFSLPVRQDIKVTVVQHLQDFALMARKMMAQK